MKTIFLSTLAFLLTFSAIAQEGKTIIDKIQGSEIGLTSNLNNLNLNFKFKRKENKYLLFSGASGLIRTRDVTTGTLKTGLKLNWMTNKDLTDKIFLSYGWGVGANFATNIRPTNFNVLIQPNLNYRLEFNYRLNNDFYVGAVLQPECSIQAVYSSGVANLYNANLNFSTSPAIQLYYKF